MKPQPLLLMFDLDGTLIDSRVDIAIAVNLMRVEYGLEPLPVEVVSGFIGDGLHKTVDRALEGYAVDRDEAVKVCWVHYMAHLHDKTTLYSGVEDGLRRLHAQGHLLAVISNKPGEACRTIVEHFGLTPLFSRILGDGDTEHLKPHPQPLLQTMESFGVAAGNSWMIGDHKTDIEAARLAGIGSVWVSYGIGAPSEEKPTVTFDTFQAVADFFASRNDADLS